MACASVAAAAATGALTNGEVSWQHGADAPEPAGESQGYSAADFAMGTVARLVGGVTLDASSMRTSGRPEAPRSVPVAAAGRSILAAPPGFSMVDDRIIGHSAETGNG